MFEGMKVNMSLDAFIAHWDDPDPWAVTKHEWHVRFAQLGLPDEYLVLIDPVVRMIWFEKRRERGLPIPGPNPPAQTSESEEPSEGHVGPMTRKLARVLRWKRVTSHVTIRGLSRATGLNPSTISRTERERRSPTVDELDRIAGALDYSIASMIEHARTLE